MKRERERRVGRGCERVLFDSQLLETADTPPPDRGDLFEDVH